MAESEGATSGFVVDAVLVGQVAPLGPRQIASGIRKAPVRGPVRLTREGLVGDQQGDRKHHGGPEKALHHYPADHYPAWRDHHPDIAATLAAIGAFGENLSSRGVTEAEICIGDVFRLGGATVQVSQGRQPCWRLNERFGERQMARRVQESGRTGWYYRVIEEGEIEAGATAELIDRPAGTWTLSRLAHTLYRDMLNHDALAEMAELAVLSTSWRDLARRRLARRAVEDWTSRLSTPAS
ncbi:MOSC domain-containing protein [Nitratireductor sp. CAU 1489]|uniref:MOSC domain-containing protein n=1 Tax=Nitratireductor arenosus TaxID=2682096 RepID=A0A844QCV6_9HYPH|nr:MOSC domain-containing protein [Nitratireductor arenosus]MVA95850.1 MOSC domain-containing protein [Nitratireductor arenosus]